MMSAGINGGTFLQPALQPLCDKLFELVKNRIDLFSQLIGVANTAEKWREQLEEIQGWLDVAEQNQFSNKAVEIWLGNVQDVAHDMEDVLDHLDIQAHENASKAMEQKIFKFLDYMAQSVYSPVRGTDQGILEKIENITERLGVIRNHASTLQLLVDAERNNIQPEDLRMRRESSSVASEMFAGRDDTKQEIIRRLLRDEAVDQSDTKYALIPIVGTGGIGKTTLAQHVYNDEQLNHLNYLKAWVCVSDVLDIKRITIAIINQVDDNGAVVKFNELEEAHNRLMVLLSGRKFIIVLDDVWNLTYEAWDNLQRPFQHAAKGSSVIMTTRKERIVKLINTNSKHDNIINLKGLTDAACWNIVQHHAKNKTGLTDEMRDDIIKKCKGLPLAAKALGFTLKINNIKEFQHILKNDFWSKIASEILPVLRLSYHDLPIDLKRIFAYSSIFPKDYKFKEEEFVLLCMAQHLLPQEESKPTTGHERLWDLVSSSLLEVDPISQKEFIMPDLIHDLALQVAGNIFHVTDTKDMTEVAKKRARHVSLTANTATTLASQLRKSSQLRTLYCSYAIADENFIESFSCIRALSLDSNEVKELPEGIGDLKHLRFLKLKCHRIEELPRLISKLLNLQTLWLDGKLNEISGPDLHLPSFLRYLKIRGFQNLKNLSVGNCSNLTSFWVEDCLNLETLVGNFTSLIELHLQNCPELQSLPQGILSAVENLTLRDVGSSTGSVDSIPGPDLDLPSSLGELSIKGFQNLKSMNCSALPNLECLHISRCPNFEFFGDNALSPLLQEVRIYDCDLIKQHLRSEPHGRIHVDGDRYSLPL